MEDLEKRIKSGRNLYIHQNSEFNSSDFLKKYIDAYIEVDETILFPRIVILCSSNEKASALFQVIEQKSMLESLTYCLCNDSGNKVKQRNDLYSGVDVVVGTIKRVGELYFQNGLNLSQLKTFFIVDAEKFTSNYTLLLRLKESMTKTQKVIFYQDNNERFDDFKDDFLENYDKYNT